MLLASDEPEPTELIDERGGSDFVLLADHAGRRIPRALGDLGLGAADMERHIAWDIGIAGVTRDLAARLGAVAVMQRYSRLVIDCNRPPGVPSSIPEVSEATPIPGNAALTPADAEARRSAVFAPYHARIAALLDARAAAGRRTVVIAMHSFTPIFHGAMRPWHAGLLYQRDSRFAAPLLRLLRDEGDLVVGDNEPYRVTDLGDYAIPVYGEQRGLPHVGIEIRQDLIAEPPGQRAWAERLARLLPLADAAMG